MILCCENLQTSEYMAAIVNPKIKTFEIGFFFSSEELTSELRTTNNKWNKITLTCNKSNNKIESLLSQDLENDWFILFGRVLYIHVSQKKTSTKSWNSKSSE